MSQGVAQSAGGCNCPDAVCGATLHAIGCNSLNLTDSVIEVWDREGGTLKASGRTNGLGFVVLSWMGPPGLYWIRPASGRFAGQTVLIACGATYDLFFAPASGYSCVHGCVTPASNTLTATHTIFGPSTSTAVGPIHSFGWLYPYPGCGPCAPLGPLLIPVSLIFDLRLPGVGSLQWPGAPVGLVPEDCPVPFNPGHDVFASIWGPATYSCPPGFVWTASQTILADGPVAWMYGCVVPITVDLVITE